MTTRIDFLPSPTVSLRIVTFNVACGHLFTTNRAQRMAAIGWLLRQLDPDLVALQESFTRGDRQLMLAALVGSRLVHLADFPAGVVGNGLLTMSAFPIIERTFHRYRYSSPWFKIHQGDWWAGKGIGLIRVRVSEELVIDFYNTHTQPDRGDPANRLVRERQLQELVAFLERSRGADTAAFVAGDLNAPLGAGEMRKAMAAARLVPVMAVPSDLDFIFAVDDRGYQFRTIETITLAATIPASTAEIFLDRAPTPVEFWRMHRSTGGETALSDHTGYLSTVAITRTEAGRATREVARSRGDRMSPGAADA